MKASDDQKKYVIDTILNPVNWEILANNPRDTVDLFEEVECISGKNHDE